MRVDSEQRPQRRALKVGAIAVPLVGYTAAAYVVSLGPTAALVDAPFELSLWVLLGAFVLTELLTVEIESRSEAHSFNLVEAVYVAGLLLADPAAILVGRAVATALVLGVIRRQSAHKFIINLSIVSAESVTVVLVFRALLGSGSPVDPPGWLAIYLAMGVAYLVPAVFVTLAITLLSGWPGRSMVAQVFIVGWIISFANTSVGIAVVASVWTESYAGLLLLIVVAVLFFLHRSYVRLRERHKSLETLHDFTRSLGGALALEEVEDTVLVGARSILRAEHGSLLMPPVRDGEPAIRVTASGAVVARTAISPAELAADLAMLLPDGQARLLGPGQPLPPWLAGIGVTDGLVVPVSSDGLPSGAMVVVNRLTEFASFVEDDLPVFETLASHGGVALENGRLVATLQHDAAEKAYQALHDPVTDLPNRAALTEQLGSAIAAARAAGRMAAVVFVDLDTFKEVNDTLGTATGDILLGNVRDRINGLLPAGAVLARFTGDVFAVLLPDLADGEPATELAEQLHDAFDEPFGTGDVSLVLGASLGIAWYPEHATSADLLLQRADAATYAARLAGSGIEVYHADADPYAPRRLALAADLREALERDEVDVFVQPKVAVADGMVLGAEALVRWTHHRLGPLGPDQFIPAAEHTGVIRALTLYVVRNALAQCRSWREAGHDLGVAVNLSARNLFDSHLVEDLGAILAESGVPPACLTLELTESTVMGDSHRSMEVLEGISSLGVGISVDDFGTGYSSLTHLRRLPISELKIDKSFVSTMTTDEHDAVIVRTLVELGRSLGLRTVAEGVENQAALDMLRQIGCDQAQGYLLSRPLPAQQFTTWLRLHEVASLAPPEGVVPMRSPHRHTGTEER